MEALALSTWTSRRYSDTTVVMMGRVLGDRWPWTESDLASGHQGDMRLLFPEVDICG